MIDVGDLPGWGSLVLAGAALALSIYSSRKSDRAADELRRAEKAWRLEIDQYGEIHEWGAGAKAWGGRVLTIISQMQSNSDAKAEDRQMLLCHLSALIDEGRWIFPNTDFETYGQNKEFAYAGIRQRILDDLVYIHDIYRDRALFGRPMTPKDISDLRRDFVSELQAQVNPDRTLFEDIKSRREKAGGEAPVIEFAKQQAPKASRKG
jgi:hypothetical protein